MNWLKRIFCCCCFSFFFIYFLFPKWYKDRLCINCCVLYLSSILLAYDKQNHNRLRIFISSFQTKSLQAFRFHLQRSTVRSQLLRTFHALPLCSVDDYTLSINISQMASLQYNYRIFYFFRSTLVSLDKTLFVHHYLLIYKRGSS